LNALWRWSIVLDASHCLVYYGKIWHTLQHQMMRVGGVEQEKLVTSKLQKFKSLNICLGTKCQNKPSPINFSSHANGLTGVTGFSSEADLEFADAGGEKEKSVARSDHTASGRDNGKSGSVEKNESLLTHGA
jgi:hypothetical protein